MESSRMFLVVLYVFARSHRHEKKYESNDEVRSAIVRVNSPVHIKPI